MNKISFNGNLFTHWIFQIVYHSTKFICSMRISHMMSDIKNDDEKFNDQSWNHHNKNKINRKHRKWLKKTHFMDVKKVYFHQILLDEWKEMNWWILINFIHFWCSSKLNEFCENWWIDQNWMIRDVLTIHSIRISIFSNFYTHFHYKQLKIKIYSK